MQTKNIFLLFLLSLLFAVPGFSKPLLLKSGTIDIKDQKSSFSNMSLGGATGVELMHDYFIVQFKNKIQKSDQDLLKNKNIQVVRYIPEDAYLVKADASDLAQLLGSSKSVYEVIPYLAQWKLSNEFSGLSVFDKVKYELINLSILPGADLNKVKSAVSALSGVDVISITDSEMIVKATRANVLGLSQIEGVEWIQVQPRLDTFTFDGFSEANDSSVQPPVTGHESGTKIMNFDAVWAQGFNGRNQIVAMADTGLDTGKLGSLHPDLETVQAGFAMGLFSTSWADPQGHGTHVAGSVVGTGRASQGSIKGGAYAAGFIAAGMWSDLMNNITVPPDFVGLFKTPYASGARIHTNSWGSAQNLGAYDNFSNKVDQFIWDNPDMTILFAAGNSGQDMDKNGVIDGNSISSPGTAKNVITVGASENYFLDGGKQEQHFQLRDGEKKWGAEPIRSDKLSNNANGLACFSSRGPTQDGRIKPDIVAPGTNIISLASRDPKATKLWGAYDSNYNYAGGTSMATPLTAGAATVTRQVLVDKFGQANPSGALVKATLVHTAVSMYPGQYGEGPTQEIPKQSPNNQEGYGRVDMSNVAGLNPVIIDDNKTGLAVGEEATYTVNVSGNDAKLRLNLVYSDFPASAAAQRTLVNDLDLVVVDPSGASVSKKDTVNNSEMIEVSGLTEGSYTVIVKGINVPQGLNGKQPYALVGSLALKN